MFIFPDSEMCLLSSNTLPIVLGVGFSVLNMKSSVFLKAPRNLTATAVFESVLA